MKAKIRSVRVLTRIAIFKMTALAAVVFAWLLFGSAQNQQMRYNQVILNDISKAAIDMVTLASEMNLRSSSRVLSQWHLVTGRLQAIIQRAIAEGGVGADRLALQAQRTVSAMEENLRFQGKNPHRSLHLVLETQRLSQLSYQISNQIAVDMRRSELELLIFVISAFIASLMIHGAAAWRTRRLVLEPLGQLVPDLIRIGANDLSQPVRVPDVEELRMLGQALEHMRQDLLKVTVSRDSLDREVSDRRVAEQRALDLLSELKATQENQIQLEKLSVLGVFIGGVAHEIGNPLMTIDNYLGYVAEKTEVARHREILDKASHEVERIKRIVKDLLMYVRKGDDHTSGSCRVSDAVDVVKQRFEGTLKTHKLRLSIEIQQRLPDIAIAQDTMIQVLTNLFGNAIHAVEGAVEPTVWLIVARFGDQVELTITDNGAGVARSIEEKIFDPFFTTKPPGKGTGLGLGITRQLLHDAGGEIHLQTGLEQGTAFKLTLPIVNNAPDAAASEAV